MLNITILSLGGIKTKYLQEGVDGYLKRLKPYAKISLVELKAEAFNDSNRVAAKKIEGERIKQFLDKQGDAKIFLLDERGQEPTSLELAQTLQDDGGHYIFVIGGALGLAENLLKTYNLIALSKLTFLHEMTKLILLEQIYRVITISKNKTYHY